MDETFQGEVYLSEYITSLMNTFPELQGIVEDFKSYWRTGHHPDFGKDTPLHDPASIRQSAVRHIHIIPRPVSAKDDQRWLKSFRRLVRTNRPVSDSWLVYCVTEERDCCLLAFLQEDAHFKSRKSFFIGKMIDGAEAFFSDIEQYPLSESEQVNIFDDKWLIKDLSSDV